MNVSMRVSAVVVSLAFSTLAGGASAQDNVQKLMNMNTTGASLDVPTIQQTGPAADAIKQNLENVKLPPGFEIALYAIVPDARHMAVGPSTGVVFVGTRKTKIWSVTDRPSAAWRTT